jgi:hypothetical protein
MATKKARSRRSTKKRTASPKQKAHVVAHLKGRPVRVRVRPDATKQDRQEAAQYAQTLDSNDQIAHGKSLTPGTTHQIEKDSEGKEVLVRKRFSSI